MAQPNPDAQWSLAVMAGVFALLGVAVGHLLTALAAWTDRKRRKNEMLLAKLDEMMVAFEHARGWCIEMSQANTLQALQEKPFVECGRIQALSILYFRDLETPLADYMNSLRTYYIWSVECLSSLGPNAELPIPLDAWLRMSDEYSEQTKRHCTTILECQQRLIAAMKSTADKLINC